MGLSDDFSNLGRLEDSSLAVLKAGLRSKASSSADMMAMKDVAKLKEKRKMESLEPGKQDVCKERIKTDSSSLA